MQDEKSIEKYLDMKVKQAGGMTIKQLAIHINGLPDRLCLLPNSRSVWVEVKAPGQKPRLLQTYRMRELEALGQNVEWVDSKEAVDRLIEKYYVK